MLIKFSHLSEFTQRIFPNFQVNTTTFEDIDNNPSGSPRRQSVPALYIIMSGRNSLRMSSRLLESKKRYSASCVPIWRWTDRLIASKQQTLF